MTTHEARECIAALRELIERMTMRTEHLHLRRHLSEVHKFTVYLTRAFAHDHFHTSDFLLQLQFFVAHHTGHRVTRAREQTFRLLLRPEPQSVKELLTKAGGAIDRVTVYRNLELFEQLGILHRIYIGWKYKLELSDAFIAHHHHLSCLSCGRTIDIADEAHIDQFIHEISVKYGFTPRRHQFEIDGYCRECSAKHT